MSSFFCQFSVKYQERSRFCCVLINIRIQVLINIRRRVLIIIRRKFLSFLNYFMGKFLYTRGDESDWGLIVCYSQWDIVVAWVLHVCDNKWDIVVAQVLSVPDNKWYIVVAHRNSCCYFLHWVVLWYHYCLHWWVFYPVCCISEIPHLRKSLRYNWIHQGVRSVSLVVQ